MLDALDALDAREFARAPKFEKVLITYTEISNG